MVLGPSELSSLAGQELHRSAIRTDYGLRSRLEKLVRTKGMNSLKLLPAGRGLTTSRARGIRGKSPKRKFSHAKVVNLKDPCTLTSLLSALLSSPPRYFKVPTLLLSHGVTALCQTTES
jgi:hypothetical protein